MLLPQRLVALPWRWPVLLPTVSACGGLCEPGAGILVAEGLAQILHGLPGLALDVRGNSDLDGHQQVAGGLLGRQSLAAHAQSAARRDRKSTRLNSSHVAISYAVFCLKKKKTRYAKNATRNK